MPPVTRTPRVTPNIEHLFRETRQIVFTGFIVKGPADVSPVPVNFTRTHLSLSAAPAARRAAALPPPPAPSNLPPQAARIREQNHREENHRDRDRRPALPPPPSWCGLSANDVTRTHTHRPRPAVCRCCQRRETVLTDTRGGQSERRSE